MFGRIKLATLSWVFAAFMLFISVLLVVAVLLLDHHISMFSSSWEGLHGYRTQKLQLHNRLQRELGYAGLINAINHYIATREEPYMETAQYQIGASLSLINQYAALPLEAGEQEALAVLRGGLAEYSERLGLVHRLSQQGDLSVDDMARNLMVDSAAMVAALESIERNLTLRLDAYREELGLALARVSGVMTLSTWAVIILLVLLAVLVVWVMHVRMLRPLLQLADKLVRLSHNDLTVDVSGYTQPNEIGHMARAVEIFRDNLQARQEVERNLSAANDQLNRKLEIIRTLQQEAEQQALNAMGMAGKLAVAREEAVRAMAKAEAEEHRILSILNAVRDAIITIGDQGMIESFNPAAEAMFGYHSSEALHEPVALLAPAEWQRALDIYMRRMLRASAVGAPTRAYQVTGMRRGGESFPVEVCPNTVVIAGEFKIIAVLRDITERQRWEEDIKRLAMTDPLTGLANRNHFNARLSAAAGLARRMQHSVALLLIDLDRFKPVNDNWGHSVGDALLQEVAGVLLKCCREIDTVARIGGDEFAIILNGVSSDEEILHPATRILDTLASIHEVDGRPVSIGASIGIACFPEHAENLDKLLLLADQAMYQAKGQGRNAYVIYQP